MNRLLKLTLFLFLLWLPTLAHSQGVTLSGNLATIMGTNYTSSSTAFVRVVLKNYQNAVPIAAGSGVIIATSQDLYPDGSGNISQNIWGNDQLLPATTYYQLQFYNGGKLAFAANYLIYYNSGLSTTFSFNSQAPLTYIPNAPTYYTLLLNPPGSQSVNQPAGTSLTLNGNIIINGTLSGVSFPSLTLPNTWTALQTFNAGITGTGNTGALQAGSGILGNSNTFSASQNFGAGLTSTTMSASTSISAPILTATGTNGGVSFPLGNGSAVTPSASNCTLYGNTTTTYLHVNCGNGTHSFDITNSASGVLVGDVALNTATGGFSPAASTTYYVGPIGKGFQTVTGSQNSWIAPAACTIDTASYYLSVGGTLDTTANAWTFTLYKNNVALSDTANTTLAANVGASQVNITAPNDALVAGDKIQLVVATPTFGTAPTTVIAGTDFVCK